MLQSRRIVHVCIVRSLLSLVVIWFTPAARICSAAQTGTEPIDYDVFQEAIDESNDAVALSSGKLIFVRLGSKYKADAGFGALKSKLMASEFMAKQMESQLRQATSKRMLAVADELFEQQADSQGRSLQVAPAERLYESSTKLFSKRVMIQNLTEEEKKFLAAYYDLKLRGYSTSIAKAGQALAVAEPSFKGTYNYVMVLPLLHASNTQPVKVSVLPRWMQKPSQLDLCSDSCLLHYGMPYQAMELARQSSIVRGKEFSEFEFYHSASRKCGTSLSSVAVECLGKAMENIPADQSERVVDLKFEIVQLWLDSGNYSLAAGRARDIYQEHTSHPESGKAGWLYFYALSRTNNTDAILANIDTALSDERCITYRAKLMYIKWWALRRKRDQVVKVAALEHELLQQYGDNSMVAPILLSRATDCLAQQDYAKATIVLDELVKKFPATKAADQAKKMLEKLQKITN